MNQILAPLSLYPDDLQPSDNPFHEVSSYFGFYKEGLFPLFKARHLDLNECCEKLGIQKWPNKEVQKLNKYIKIFNRVIAANFSSTNFSNQRLLDIRKKIEDYKIALYNGEIAPFAKTIRTAHLQFLRKEYKKLQSAAKVNHVQAPAVSFALPGIREIHSEELKEPFQIPAIRGVAAQENRLPGIREILPGQFAGTLRGETSRRETRRTYYYSQLSPYRRPV